MFGLRRKSGPRPLPQTPPGARIYAVGDVHGRADLLEAILTVLRADHAARPALSEPPILVFLGDYVDRGSQSPAVLQRLATPSALAPFAPRFLKGNHETALLRFLEEPQTGATWVNFGGAETLFAYGVPPPPAGAPAAAWTGAAAALRAAIPSAHFAFLEGLELSVRLGDYVFVHAGLRPGRAWDAQTEADMLTIRDPFLKAEHPFDFTVVHGHTPVPAPEAKSGRIGIDTGAYVTGRLSAVRLEGEEQSFLSTESFGPLWRP